MKLLTKEILKAFETQGDTSSKKAEDTKVIVKFFSPISPATWYATEYDQKTRTFFGFADLFGDPMCAELGSFSLNELESVQLPFGLKIERDLYFGEYTLADVMKKHGK